MLNKPVSSALRIALIYAFFAACWILFSDLLVEMVLPEPEMISQVQTYKGLTFVCFTAFFLFLMVLSNNLALEKANDMDSLTGLYSINLFIRTFDLRIKSLQPGERLILGYLDIDDFRLLNESIGFERADQLLQELAMQFKFSTLPGSVVARTQAAQFASFSPIDDSVDMEAHVRNIQTVFGQRCRNMGIQATCSIGVAQYPIDGSCAKELMVAATEALNIAKRKKNAIQYHDKTLSEKALLRRQMLLDLQHAVDNDALQLVYQPKYQLKDRQASGVEVLVRWHHDKQGFIAPDVFIPLAEEAGLSGAISRLVIKKTALELQNTGLLGTRLQHVAVNVSATEFNNAAEMEQLSHFIHTQTSLTPYMRIEMTETATLNDMKKSMDMIAHLQASGLTFSVDDFGTGYTSLAMLKNLTVDEIKIDRSFVSEIVQDKRSRTIVDAIIAMAKSFNINVVAEGVETQAQLDALCAMGCEEAQGYFLGRPMAVNELVLHLQQT